MLPLDFLFPGQFGIALAIVLSALVSEDAATISAATLSAASLLHPALAFASAAAGLWIGDLGVYAAARWFHRFGALSSTSSGASAARNLALSRFFPGTRLPAYVRAGLDRMPLAKFALITASTACLWTLLIFQLLRLFPARAQSLGSALATLSLAGLALFAALVLLRRFRAQLLPACRRAWLRLSRWEFWPAWLFYAPVALFYAFLALRFRGLTLPTLANLNQRHGGLICESKFEILQELQRTSPEFVAATWLIPSGHLEDRLAAVNSVLSRHNLSYPFILKPDVAQRGAGFRKVDSPESLRQFLADVSVPLLLQPYIPGPFEAGIFYYRFPSDRRGHLFAITRKRFPIVTGDGRRTLRELIHADPRASLFPLVYERRFSSLLDTVLNQGDTLRLVEAGNHCQGCIFEEGGDLGSDALRKTMDRIAFAMPGFFVGRFDVRFASESALREGRDFRILELNGAGSEATSLYDVRNSLWSAYRTLYRQWRLIFAIGAENRRRAARPSSLISLWRDSRRFAASAGALPIAD